MNRELTIVQRLINALDDSRSLYGKQVDKVVHPDLQEWLERAVDTHWVIADDLGDRMIAAGNNTARYGSHRGSLRALLAEGLARISFDIDMAYASHAVQREACILRDFRDAAISIRDTELRNRLQAHCRKIERASMQICCLRSTMQLRADPRVARTFVIAHVPARSSAPQIVARGNRTKA